MEKSKLIYLLAAGVFLLAFLGCSGTETADLVNTQSAYLVSVSDVEVDMNSNSITTVASEEIEIEIGEQEILPICMVGYHLELVAYEVTIDAQDADAVAFKVADSELSSESEIGSRTITRYKWECVKDPVDPLEAQRRQCEIIEGGKFVKKCSFSPISAEEISADNELDIMLNNIDSSGEINCKWVCVKEVVIDPCIKAGGHWEAVTSCHYEYNDVIEAQEANSDVAMMDIMDRTRVCETNRKCVIPKNEKTAKEICEENGGTWLAPIIPVSNLEQEEYSNAFKSSADLDSKGVCKYTDPYVPPVCEEGYHLETICSTIDIAEEAEESIFNNALKTEGSIQSCKEVCVKDVVIDDPDDPEPEPLCEEGYIAVPHTVCTDIDPIAIDENANDMVLYNISDQHCVTTIACEISYEKSCEDAGGIYFTTEITETYTYSYSCPVIDNQEYEAVAMYSLDSSSGICYGTGVRVIGLEENCAIQLDPIGPDDPFDPSVIDADPDIAVK